MKPNVASQLLQSIAHDISAVCLIDDAGEIRRGQLLAAVRQRSESLRAEGVLPDEFVVVLCGRGTTFWIDLLALWVIGAKPICLEPDIEDEHGANVLALAQPLRISIQDLPVPPSFASLKPLPPAADPHSMPAEAVSHSDFPFVATEQQPDVAGLIFTSGSTGLPKGVPLTHQQLIMNALGTSTRLRLQASDRLMIATPFRFISSISHFIVTVMSGAAFAGTEAKLFVKDLVDLLVANHITAFGGSPFHLHFLAMAGTSRIPALRWAMSSGDHLPVDTIDALLSAFPELELHTVYGMSELGGRMLTLPPAELHRKKGSVGLALPGIIVEVRDDTGDLAEPQELGEVYIKSSFGFGGYFGNAQATDAALSKHGFRTGDKGYKDDDGFVYLAGRSDSVFKRSGLKVSTRTITDAIAALDCINDVFVDSEEDIAQGRVPIAYVSVNEQGFDQPAVLRALREVLPTNHIPSKFIEVDAIPRTGSGKVDRRLIATVAENAQ